MGALAVMGGIDAHCNPVISIIAVIIIGAGLDQTGIMNKAANPIIRFGAGADPRIAALVAGLAVSNSFILPTRQVNALLMGPDGYRTKDYIKAGSGMTVIFLIVMILGLWTFYGL